jgi:hypothetical protein
MCTRIIVALVLVLICAVAPAHAFTMTFNESGGCSATDGTATVNCSVTTTQTDPTGLVSKALIFTLPTGLVGTDGCTAQPCAPGSTGVFPGQISIFEDGTTTLSDGLRFVTSTGCFASQAECGALATELIFYSFDSNGALADVGNVASFACSGTSCGTRPENANGTFQFISSTGLNTYNGTSAAVPLPAALPLFATGLGALGLLGWRRKRKAQAGA